jgi:transcriptional regulator with XRE-family HTH domain
VKPDTTWPDRLNVQIGDRLSEVRRMRKLTAAQLAERVTALGLPMSRSKIANLENGRGRREGISVAEVHALAAGLGVSPLLLVFPLGQMDVIEPLPGVEVSPWDALRWAMGQSNLAGAREVSGSETRVIEWFRVHQMWLDTWAEARRRAEHAHRNQEALDTVRVWDLEQSRAVVELQRQRELIRSADLTPPELPAELQFIDPRQGGVALVATATITADARVTPKQTEGEADDE